MKIVFPVAGVGTRFLPATKEVPKEMLPVIDKPLIQYAVEEALQSGLDDFIFITAPGKEALERYFAPNRELDAFLEHHGKTHLLDGLQEFFGKNFSYILQEHALGFGHAIALAEKAVGNEAFAISLPDDLILSRRPVMAQLLEVYEKYKSPVIAFMEVPKADIPRYGIAAGTFLEERVFHIEKLVEKPALADADPQGTPGGSVPWQQLSPEQQRVLGQFRGRWDRMPPQQQEALLRGAERWESLSPDQRQRVEQRAQQWRNMTPEQREDARDRALRFKELSPDEQQRLREEYRRYRDTPPDQREAEKQKRREQWQQMSPEDQEKARDKARAKREKQDRQDSRDR